MRSRRNDDLRTGAAAPAFVLRIVIVALVAGAAVVLIPVTLWQVIAVIAALLGAFIPQSLGGWLALGCITVGMLLDEASIWRAMLAVLVVALCHAVFALLLAVPQRSRIVLTALVPTLRRLLLIQLVAQPLTVLVMLLARLTAGSATETGALVLAPVLGAAALAVFVIGFLRHLKRAERRS